MKVTQLTIERARERVEQLEHKFLRERGWEYTSQTPTRRWLWKKTVAPYGTLLVTHTDAIEIELMS